MSPDDLTEREIGLEETHEFAEPPEHVWRALTTPALRERWLPTDALASPEPISVTPGRDVSYRMREEAPPFLESIVTFRVEPGEAGGTRVRILHELTDIRVRVRKVQPANGNTAPLMRAA